MSAIFKYEMKSGLKSLLIWALSVGGMGLICILLYAGMEDNIAEMAQSMADMGAFSDAFGMSSLSIATLMGYFATEIGTIHSLGSSMFAASIATVILSKEEENHTAEFTFTLPVSRQKTIAIKYLAVILQILAFNIICLAFYVVGFIALGETDICSEFYAFMALQLLMNIEISSICFMISATSKKNKLGLGISVALVFYVYDLMSRIIPDMKDIAFLSPFSYVNATNIFSGVETDVAALALGIAVIVSLIFCSGLIYTKRDLAS